MKTFDNFGYGTEEETADLGTASPSPNAVRKGSQAGRIAELDKFWKLFSALCISRVTPARASSRNFNPANATFVELHCCDLPHRYWSSRVVSSLSL